jgi:hypothetical protein
MPRFSIDAAYFAALHTPKKWMDSNSYSMPARGSRVDHLGRSRAAPQSLDGCVRLSLRGLRRVTLNGSNRPARAAALSRRAPVVNVVDGPTRVVRSPDLVAADLTFGPRAPCLNCGRGKLVFIAAILKRLVIFSEHWDNALGRQRHS